jgi:isoleucyl-tRNA synthetase
MFEEVSSQRLQEREEQILDFWQKEDIFEKSVKNRESNPYFSFYDGPPFATGLPHYGHLLAGTIKDVVPRYKTMKGYYVPRRFGWDCHGLPVENEIEKSFELSGADSIEAFGIAKFNEECRSIVLRYTEEWKKTVNRMGRWVDFKKTYKTMDLSFMESVWWVFSELYKKGLVYQGHKVMPYSAKLGTPLSNFEAGENYKDVDDPALTVAFKVDDNTSILAWTTTPWTLISNLALMVGPDITYAKVKSANHYYILAKARIPEFFKENFEVVEEFLGSELVGTNYHPLFDYFKDEKSRGAFRVIAEDSVSLDEGTGIVHSAPAFGEVDFYACKKAGIEHVAPVNSNGQFTDQIPEYAGYFVKDADKEIIARLKKMGHVFHHATVRHRYPFCWRSDTPLIYLAVSTWFVAVEKIKDKLIEANKKINWTPSHIKEGRFGRWLEGARDWAISRSRYWGTPIPLWMSEDGEIKVIGSIKELEELTNTKINDLHRHFIDHLTFSINGKVFKRIPEVFDCWFESGSMPYAQNHYPYENKEVVESTFPADFIAEGADQTRGWFYTLTILSAALFDCPAFKNVIVNGIVLAEDGNKMSKRLKNYPEPGIVIEKFGADAVRLFLISSPAVRADDLRFSERGVEVVLRQVLIPLWNAYTFLVTYARIYQWKPAKSFEKPSALIDQWILSKLHKLIFDVEKGMDAYDLSLAVEPFVAFIDELTNWYIRRSRTRFWSDIDSQDRRQAFETLYTVLIELSKIAAPFIPFIAESIYQNLKGDGVESVHLSDFPSYDTSLRDFVLEKGMDYVQKVVSLGHALRKENKIKVRQPLSKVYLASSDEELLKFLNEHQNLVLEELNVKEAICLSDETSFVTLVAKANFRVLGKKAGKLMKSAVEKINQLKREELAEFLDKQTLKIEVEGETIVLTQDDLVIDRIVKEGVSADHIDLITIALDTTLNESLILEGIARELKNKINTMRKDQGFAVTDRVHLSIDATSDIIKAFETHKDYIMSEVLALSVQFKKCLGVAWDINGNRAIIEVNKA